MRGIDEIADHLQREVCLDARAHIEIAAMEQRPAIVTGLNAAQIIPDLGFEGAVDRLAEVVPQQNIFRRNGRIGFQLEYPMTVALAIAQQRVASRGNAGFQRGFRSVSLGFLVRQSHSLSQSLSQSGIEPILAALILVTV